MIRRVSFVLAGLRPNSFLACPAANLVLRLVRIGVPVTMQRVRAGKYLAHSLNPSNTTLARRAFRRFAFPGIALDSWIKVGSLSLRPIKMGAVEVKPPIPKTASGLNSRYRLRQRARLTAKPRVNPNTAEESKRGMPTDGNFSNR